MALTPSTMLELGTPAPDFALPDTEGCEVRLDDLRDAPLLLVMFLSNHCPYVIHIREHLARFVASHQAKGLAAVAINANDVARYPADSPEKMKDEVALAGYTFPYLFDASQEVAKAYRAACTPDFFLFDQDRKLVYRGRYDQSRPGNDIPLTGQDLAAAIEAAQAGRPPLPDQIPSMGCNIKWRAGNEPDYF
ncbi:MAG: thioredoxin family protein [Deltaproteobacteria bacterium]|nr:thioredoxin family protein [Deltaproteobacteria bacterium]